MKHYLVEVEITDGEHEHRSFGIVLAKDGDEAFKFAEKLVPDYFSYGDGSTITNIKSCLPITPKEAKTLERLRVAYEIEGSLTT